MIHWLISILEVKRKVVFIEVYQQSDILLDVLYNNLPTTKLPWSKNLS